MLSVIIPVYKEPFLQQTIDSLLENAQGEVEIIVVLDGFTPDKKIKKDPKVRIINLPQNIGMRGAINAGIAASQGDFLMKCDAHCAFGLGFDKIMIGNCAKNWLMIPRRYSLDPLTWQKAEHRPVIDYHYLTFPTETKHYGLVLSNQPWEEKTLIKKDPKYDIDDTMTFQGSCWLANKKYFMKQVGFLDDRHKTYSSFVDEPQEIGLKYWLGGGKVKVIKKTWYAHLSKRRHHYDQGLFEQHYKLSRISARGRTWSAKHWINNEEPGMIHPFSWLVEKFWPVPTWPEDRSLWQLT